MTECIDRDKLRALVRDSLPAAERMKWIRHLDSCTNCQSSLDSFTSTEKLDFSSLMKVEKVSTSIQQVVDRLKSAALTTSAHQLSLDSIRHLLESDSETGKYRFSQYNVLDCIGAGSMGIVLRAYDESLGRQVAIKVVAPELARNSSSRERFLREAKLAAGIEHENVVTIHSIDEHKGVPFFVMQLVEGQTLHELLEKSGPLPEAVLMRIATEAARGLAAAHEKSVVHRDIKPANILIEERTSRVILTDFGLAKAADDANLTRIGTVAGTPNFMSPEQAKGDPVGEQSDLFSLGAVLFTAATGEAPFACETIYGVLRKVCEEEPRFVTELNANISSRFSDLVARLLRKSPSERFSSANELVQALDSAALDTNSKQSGLASAWSTLLGIGCTLLLLWSLFHYWPDTAIKDQAQQVYSVVGSSRRFASLGEAVRNAADGEIIEVDTDECVTESELSIEGKSLSIRAAAGCRPSIVQASESKSPWLTAKSSDLRLQGLRLVQSSSSQADSGPAAWMNDSFISTDASLVVEDCILEVNGRSAGLALDGKTCELKNTVVYSPNGACIKWFSQDDSSLRATGCTLRGRYGILTFRPLFQGTTEAELDHCTIDTEKAILVGRSKRATSIETPVNRQACFLVQANNNFINTQELVAVFRTPAVDTGRAIRFLRNVVDWNGSSNVYASVIAFASVSRGGPDTREILLGSIEEWQQYKGELNSALATCELEEISDSTRTLRLKSLQWQTESKVANFGTPTLLDQPLP